MGLTGYLAKEVGFVGRFRSIRRLRSKFATSCMALSLYLRRPSFEDRVPLENQEIPKQDQRTLSFGGIYRDDKRQWSSRMQVVKVRVVGGDASTKNNN